MKKVILAVAIGLAVISCKKDETSTAIGSNTPLDQGEKDASYAFGISLGQGAERYNQQPDLKDSLDINELKRGINDFLNNPKELDSYAYGLSLGKQIQGALDNKVIAGRLDRTEIVNGMMDYLNKKDTRVKVDSVPMVMDRFFQNQMTKSAENNKKAGIAYLNNIKKEDGIQTTPSGLTYKVVQAGSGEKPGLGDVVKVKYKGTTINGDVFDSTEKNNGGEPLEFPLNPGGLIDGWIEGMQLMPKGSKYTFYIPAELGYGDRGNASIGPGETLIFDIELVDFAKSETPSLNPGVPGVNIVPSMPNE
ncbi:MAG: FKBP-type peptidyl-prolyl cis-trans isomerase [Flavobacteriaceae bacterium]|nr:FKBP-type peptidyl-prolyl cis-trans isomerase [Flavobacteriaceae bacterium]